VFRFICRGGYSEDAARDLTQGFFTQLLALRGIAGVEPDQGTFRSYLLGAVKHFLADQLDRARAAKRGGGQALVPLVVNSETHATTCLQIIDPGTAVPDAFFDREWALNVIARSLGALAAELTAAGKPKVFEILKPWLVGEVGGLSQAEAGRQLGLTEGAVKVAVHRLRKRFRELVKAEIGGTVARPLAVQEELHYLIEALAQN
jgi:RNA polymerase sigma-70 factor (ECF subfamily)